MRPSYNATVGRGWLCFGRGRLLKSGCKDTSSSLHNCNSCLRNLRAKANTLSVKGVNAGTGLRYLRNISAISPRHLGVDEKIMPKSQCLLIFRIPPNVLFSADLCCFGLPTFVVFGSSVCCFAAYRLRRIWPKIYENFPNIAYLQSKVLTHILSNL